MKIAVLDGRILNPGDISWEPISSLGEFVCFDETAPADIRERAAGADVILTNKTPLRRACLKDLPDAKLVGVLATGHDVVDSAAFAERGIPVCNVVAYGVDDVAQHAFALLMELCRRTSDHSRSIKDGEWKACGQWCYWKTTPVNLRGLTMGLVGFGSIGRRMGELASAFGMKVVAHCRTPRNPPHYGSFSFGSLDQVLASSDVISLHCPLTEETQAIIRKETIAKMKDGVFLINTARGPLLNEADVARALKSGKIAGLGADVLAKEPPAAGNPLLAAPNTILTPHMAWATAQSRQNIIDLTAENIRRWQAGTPVNVVNGVKAPARA